MRFVITNVLLFVAYTGMTMIGIWIDVRGRQEWFPINTLSEGWLSSAVLIAYAVNWWLLRLRNPAQRILLGIGTGLLVCAIAILPFYSMIIHFILAIGGTL